MFNWFKRSQPSYPLSSTPQGFFSPPSDSRGIASGEEACTLSAFWAGLRLYQTQIGSMPLITYRRESDDSRTKAKTHNCFKLLHERPNPAQSRATFLESLIGDYWIRGEFFVLVQRHGNQQVKALYPIPWHSVLDVKLSPEWEKEYHVRTKDGHEIYSAREVIHVVNYSRDGLRGESFLRYACENLGLHKQVQQTADALFRNAARFNTYFYSPGKVDDKTKANIQQGFSDGFAGAVQAGKTPFIDVYEIKNLTQSTSEDMQLVESLGISSQNVSQWYGCSPSDIGDQSQSRYNSVAADREIFYQRSVRPILDRIELEFNAILFGVEADTYCEFLTSVILRGSPQEEQAVLNGYVQTKVLTENEVRAILNYPALPEPQQASPPPTEEPPTVDQPQEDTSSDAPAIE